MRTEDLKALLVQFKLSGNKTKNLTADGFVTWLKTYSYQFNVSTAKKVFKEHFNNI